jgi:hypothetical protein
VTVFGRHMKIHRMAALAAILILLPGSAFAEVCDKGDIGAMFLPLSRWLASLPLDPRLQPLLLPANWVTAGLMAWIILGSSAKATMAAAVWFALRAGFAAVAYFSIDLGDLYDQAAIAEGCMQNSPYGMLVNLAFAAGALLLTLQRFHRQRGAPPA